MPRTVPPVLPAGHLRDRQPPTVDGDGVVLRPWRSDDAGLVQRAFADPAIVHWHMRTIDDADEARAFAEGWATRWQDETDAGFVVTRDVQEGTLSRVLLHTDGWHDVHLHAAVADQWPEPT